MPAIKKAFDLMGDDLVELSTEKESLKNQINSYDEKKDYKNLKAKPLKQIDDDEKANIILSRMQKQVQNIIKWLVLVLINYGEVNFITSVLRKLECKIKIINN